MLQRRPFKHPARPERAPMAWPGPQTFAPAGRCDGVGAVQPKGEKARPGKRTPTAEEAQWMDAIVRYGCIACHLDGVEPRPTAVHHILSGGQRMGHMHTLPLCDPGHHQGGQPLGLISRHPWKARFEAEYGTEEELLTSLRKSIAAQAKDKSPGTIVRAVIVPGAK